MKEINTRLIYDYYFKKKKKYAEMKCSIWLTDAKCLSSFLKDSIVILLTICAGRQFQIFNIQLNKKRFASFDLKCLP